MAYTTGAAVGFYSGDIRNIIDDYQTLKPTASPTVPRLLNRIYDKVHSEANKSVVKKYLLKMAIKAKSDEIRRFVPSLLNVPSTGGTIHDILRFFAGV